MQNMPSVMNKDFSQNPSSSVPHSKFNRSHGHKTTMDVDQLIPVLVDEIYPGDKIDMSIMAFARINTPIFPIMDNIKMSFQAFFTPSRILWENWEKFMGAQDDPADSVDFLIPVMTTPSTPFYTEGSIQDYMGIPTKVDVENVNILPFRAYNRIWNDWYRDENLQDSLSMNIGDGPNPAANFTLQKRNKAHDYFTSCLPWPQKGDPVLLPLSGTAPVLGIGAKTQTYPLSAVTNTYETDGTGAVNYANYKNFAATGVDHEILLEEDPTNLGFPAIFTDLTNATSATIDDLIEAFAIQALYRRDARGGTRYTEIIKSHFNVTSSDARLQRPEYLGGGSSDVQFEEIAQTSSTDGTSPQANMSAQGKILYKDKGWSRSFEEHGYLLILCSITADLTYQQGLNKMWSRQTKLDFYFPDLAHLGEQAVLNKEIYVDGSANDDLVFGYIPRWDELRYFPSLITGLFRSNAATSLDPWHLSQDFATLPVLDSDFIENNMPIDRVVALPSEPDFNVDMYFKMHHSRPMPTDSIPGLVTRF